METVGDILDKICILERRQHALRTGNPKHNKDHYKLVALKDQKKLLLEHLSDTMYKVCWGEKPAKFEKNKIYDADISKDNSDSIISAITRLNAATWQLWELEDTRRDKTNSDKERLAAADLVSHYNKIRNDTIDQINEIFSIVEEDHES